MDGLASKLEDPMTALSPSRQLHLQIRTRRSAKVRALRAHAEVQRKQDALKLENLRERASNWISQQLCRQRRRCAAEDRRGPDVHGLGNLVPRAAAVLRAAGQDGTALPMRRRHCSSGSTTRSARARRARRRGIREGGRAVQRRRAVVTSGSQQGRSTADGITAACHRFMRATGACAEVTDKLVKRRLGARTSDNSAEGLAHLMLDQAQSCFYEKAR
ncbi:hypothetical protein PHYPSEUDO_006013 [Phytophthora pseudosyringae]|uniref:BRO1 domain-containing protein n=1 Tax=Phytophthora pseudosyringae TaxID=221518 RepID=A0A8T1VJH5_9STRA|nr:hypothetical protein PHYPSEUDO_006013 [Phytophthora pseudosyringae]